jgi:photosystem II stability/assembly factor-like uncharacterized protein
MLLIDRPPSSPNDADALIEEARRRTRKRRRRIAVVLLVAAVGAVIALDGRGGGAAGHSYSGGHGASRPGVGGRATAQSIAAPRLAVLPDISDFGLLAAGEGWALTGGSGKVYFTNDDGAHWRTLKVPRPAGGYVGATVNAAASVGRNDIFLSYGPGSSYPTCRHAAAGRSAAVEDIFWVARSTDQGRTWQLSTLPGCFIARSLSFVNSRIGFAEAESNNLPLRVWLLGTRDGGRTWQHIARPPFDGPIEFATATDGWAVSRGIGGRAVGQLPATFGGALYRTTNGGRSWQRQPLCTTASAPGTFTTCSAPPHFFGPEVGVLPVTSVDRHTNLQWQTIYRTTNAGRTWTASTPLPRVPASQPDTDLNVLRAPVGDFVAVTSTHWVDLRVGGRLYTTTDAGKHWTTLVPKPDFSARFVGLDFASTRDGWLAGITNPNAPLSAAPRAFDYTINGGRNWQPLAKQ